MTATYDPASAPRRRAQGYKGDAWTVSLPPDGSEPILALDTGVDSVAILRMPNGAWHRGSEPGTVIAHDGYDETILVQRGAGTLFHGPEPERLTASRFEAPVTLVVPAGCWHHVVMDPEVTALGTCFFTVSGTVIEPFALQMEIIARGRVTFADLPVVDPAPVRATTWSETGRATVGETGKAAGDASASTGGPTPDAPANAPFPAATARILPYPPERDGLTLPLDTGRDSLFIMSSPLAQEAPAPDTVRAAVPPPEFVDVHRHPDVDEYIIRREGAGYILNGETPASITLTPFRGPCVMVMPAGAFHRIVQTEEDLVGESILIYADRRAIVERYETIMARTSVARTVSGVAPGARA